MTTLRQKLQKAKLNMIVQISFWNREIEERIQKFKSMFSANDSLVYAHKLAEKKLKQMKDLQKKIKESLRLANQLKPEFLK
jgi:hypothetical protein